MKISTHVPRFGRKEGRKGCKHQSTTECHQRDGIGGLESIWCLQASPLPMGSPQTGLLPVLHLCLPNGLLLECSLPNPNPSLLVNTEIYLKKMKCLQLFAFCFQTISAVFVKCLADLKS